MLVISRTQGIFEGCSAHWNLATVDVVVGIANLDSTCNAIITSRIVTNGTRLSQLCPQIGRIRASFGAEECCDNGRIVGSFESNNRNIICPAVEREYETVGEKIVGKGNAIITGLRRTSRSASTCVV